MSGPGAPAPAPVRLLLPLRRLDGAAWRPGPEPSAAPAGPPVVAALAAALATPAPRSGLALRSAAHVGHPSVQPGQPAPVPTTTAAAPLPHRAAAHGPSRSSAVARWTTAVRSAAEPCLLLDGSGRVCALSPSAATLLGLGQDVVGMLLADVLTVLDFSSAGRVDRDALRSTPMLRVLGRDGARDGGGCLGRGLVRLRRDDGTAPTYDVVSVPLAERAGSLSFLLQV